MKFLFLIFLVGCAPVQFQWVEYESKKDCTPKPDPYPYETIKQWEHYECKSIEYPTGKTLKRERVK